MTAAIVRRRHLRAHDTGLSEPPAQLRLYVQERTVTVHTDAPSQNVVFFFLKTS